MIITQISEYDIKIRCIVLSHFYKTHPKLDGSVCEKKHDKKGLTNAKKHDMIVDSRTKTFPGSVFVFFYFQILLAFEEVVCFGIFFD